MKWTICFADREYAREMGDPELGEVEAESQAEAIDKARADRDIQRWRFGHCFGLWAYPAKDWHEERGR